MNIELDNVSKNFKNQTVLENVNLKLESGKIYGLSLIHISEPTRRS